MGSIHATVDAHSTRLQKARNHFLEGSTIPDGLIDPIISRSWTRSRAAGISQSLPPLKSPEKQAQLRGTQAQAGQLIEDSTPIMAYLFEQIRDTASLITLADHHGKLINTLGEAGFIPSAQRDTHAIGSCWKEETRGTNAIGIALAEGRAVTVQGGEHFLLDHAFLSSAACPISAPDGRLAGVLGLSHHYQGGQGHTLGLVRFAAALIEQRLFQSTYRGETLIRFHEHEGALGTPAEGMIALSTDGSILAINEPGLQCLDSSRSKLIERRFSEVFKNELPRSPAEPYAAPSLCRLSIGNRALYLNIQHANNARKGSSSASSPLTNRCRECSLDELETGDPGIQKAISRARKIIGRDIPLLIQGESGAGKELFAKAFHHSSPRRNKPFVALNCAALPEALIESELFGYQSGAFTGARKEGAEGKFRQAHGGTLFLDEIGDMPLALQARLLRVLQERSITPLGSTQSYEVNISLVCATHRKLRDEVAAGRFREDLYYRLNGLSVTLPALRERTDIAALVSKLLHTESMQRGGPSLSISPEAMRIIQNHDWPGNIRQLSNAIRLAVAFLDPQEDRVTVDQLPEELTETLLTAQPMCSGNLYSLPAARNQMGSKLENIAQQAAQNALESAGGNISQAARLLGISRNTLYRKLGRLPGK